MHHAIHQRHLPSPVGQMLSLSSLILSKDYHHRRSTINHNNYLAWKTSTTSPSSISSCAGVMQGRISWPSNLQKTNLSFIWSKLHDFYLHWNHIEMILICIGTKLSDFLTPPEAQCMDIQPKGCGIGLKYLFRFCFKYYIEIDSYK